MALNDFRFPFRDVDIWGLDEGGEEYNDEDKASALDGNQRAQEDYLSNTLPQVYITQSSLGSGTVDPAQLASGTPGSGKAPVSQGASAPAWTDIAEQSELNTLSQTVTSVSTYAQTIPVVARGTVAWTLGVTDTNTLTTVIFSSAFAATPVVVTTVLNASDLNLASELRSVTSAQFIVRIFPTTGIAVGVSSGTVHWHAVKA